MSAEQQSDEIRIAFYEDSMFDQVVDLMVTQYGRPREKEAAAFRAFYEAPFQQPHGIRLVALDGDIVCGFQSYFYWPYTHEGVMLRTFQSGNSLVSPDYRGRQIFARLLNFLGETEDRPEIDFLMGFPVEMSYGSFLRNGWSNPLDLSWYVRPVRPLSILRGARPTAGDWRFDTTPDALDAVYPEAQFALAKHLPFQEWRARYDEDREPHYYFHHRANGGTIQFALKPNQRGRATELIVGDVIRDSMDPELLASGVRELIRATRRHRFVTMLSVALNAESRDQSVAHAFRRRGFLKIRKKIYFIVKTLDGRKDVLDPTRWHLMRSDIDTW